MIGKRLSELDTPVLWLDLDIFEENISTITSFLKQHNLQWRPHIKGIKIPEIAKKLVKAGAIGVTCAKLGEAEDMVNGGLDHILIANQIVGPLKIQRLLELCRHRDVTVAVDDAANVSEIASAAAAAGVKPGIVIEVNVGMNRAGINPGEDALRLAQHSMTFLGLNFRGVMGWEGHVTSIADPVEKETKVKQAITKLTDTAELIRDHGIPVEMVSCGGSGSYRLTAGMPGVTEIQTGGSVFGDLTYNTWGAGTKNALFIKAAVSSHVNSGWAVIDAGRKTFNCERVMPECVEYPNYKLTALSSEHGVLAIPDGSDGIKPGDKLNFIPGYEDWTVFLHDSLIGIRDGKVESVWNISGRGKLT